MALSERQTILYTDTCNIYNPSPLEADKLTYGDIQDLNYPITPSYTAQNYFHETAPEIEKGKYPIGRINREDTVSILDRVHFDVVLDIRVNALIYVTTAGDPNYGEWFLCLGEGMVKNFRANKQVFYVKASTAPYQRS